MSRSFDWFKSVVKKRVKDGKVDEKYQFLSKLTFKPGAMIVFAYDAKHKETLPIWDAVPLMIPFSANDELVYGINLHYMKPSIKRKFLENLLRRSSSSFNISGADLYSFAKTICPEAIHSYLPDHVISRPIVVPEEDYKYVADLDLASWQKRNKK